MSTEDPYYYYNRYRTGNLIPSRCAECGEMWTDRHICWMVQYKRIERQLSDLTAAVIALTEAIQNKPDA